MLSSLFALLVHEAGGEENRSVRSQTLMQKRDLVSYLPGGLSGRALDRLKQTPCVPCLHHRNVITVPFFPICQGSKGKNRIMILSWSRDSSSVRNLKKLELWLRFCSAVPTTPMEEIRRWAQGSVDLFINKVMPGRIVTLTRSSGLSRMVAVAAHNRFSSPAGMRLAGKFVSNSTNGMLAGEGSPNGNCTERAVGAS